MTTETNNRFARARRHVKLVIDPAGPGHKISRAYDYAIISSVILSIIPLMTRQEHLALEVLDNIITLFLLVDYLLRWATADIGRDPSRKLQHFLLYPFRPMAIVDLLALLPGLNLISPAFTVLRLQRIVRILRLFKVLRYYEPVQILTNVVRKESRTLGAVGAFALAYMFVCALVMFNIEDNEYFQTFFDAVYWACCTLTTVGYGDIYPISNIGRAFSMVSSFVGIALIALPSSIITTGYISELHRREQERLANLAEKGDEDKTA